MTRCLHPASRKFPASPSDSKICSDRGCTTVARSQCRGPGRASIKWHRTPRLSSSDASSSPVGPAPTTSTDAGPPATPPRSELLEECIIVSRRWKIRAHEVFRIHRLPSTRYPEPQSSPTALTSLPRMRLIAYFDLDRNGRSLERSKTGGSASWESIQ
jgi:hypothetical protein